MDDTTQETQNDFYDKQVFYEQQKEMFDEHVADENWSEVSAMVMELGERGFDGLVEELMDTLTGEELFEYNKWQQRDSGDESLQEK